MRRLPEAGGLFAQQANLCRVHSAPAGMAGPLVAGSRESGDDAAPARRGAAGNIASAHLGSEVHEALSLPAGADIAGTISGARLAGIVAKGFGSGASGGESRRRPGIPGVSRSSDVLQGVQGTGGQVILRARTMNRSGAEPMKANG
jgi:hypothetical protein